MLTLTQGTKLLLTDGTNKYILPVSSGSASQTFVEGEQDLKTIHNRDLVPRTYVQEKTNTNVSFKCYVSSTDTIVEDFILSWFGFSSNVLSNDHELSSIDMYMIANGSIYKVSDCVGETLTFIMSKSGILELDIKAQGTDLTTVTSVPTEGLSYTQPSSFYNGPITIVGHTNISAFTFEITKNIQWLNQKSIHEALSSGYYTPNVPILESFNAGGKITKNKIDDTAPVYLDSTTLDIKYNNKLNIILNNCNITERWEMEDIHKLSADYKYLSGGITITF